MTPSISLDDVEDKDKRKLLIDFTYKTVANQIAKEVWDDFESQSFCLLEKHIEKPEKSLIDHQIISCLPTRFQAVARKWDNMQQRSFLMDDMCYDKRDKTQKAKYMKEIQLEMHKKSKNKQTIRKLISEDKLNITYDKLPSYEGYRPNIAYGVPLEKR